VRARSFFAATGAVTAALAFSAVGMAQPAPAPDYRGSTGYGRDFYELIDYGGREVGDIHRQARGEVYEFLARYLPPPRRLL
ncbi:MAG: hypothetical protein B7Z68_12085, partial [Acidobacteria bacterium 21-70-11]